SSQAFQPGEVVVEEEPIQVGHIHPQSAALSAASQRRLFTFQLSHLDVAAGAIHEKASSPCRGSNAPSTGAVPSLGSGIFCLQPAVTCSERVFRLHFTRVVRAPSAWSFRSSPS